MPARACGFELRHCAKERLELRRRRDGKLAPRLGLTSINPSDCIGSRTGVRDTPKRLVNAVSSRRKPDGKSPDNTESAIDSASRSACVAGSNLQSVTVRRLQPVSCAASARNFGAQSYTMGTQKFAFGCIILAACAIDLRGSELDPCALLIIDMQREQGGVVD
jgi:hypothetical protein